MVEQSKKLTEEEIEEIAEKAATKALAKMETHLYTMVGKSVLNKLFYITGMIAVALYFYLHSHGWIK